MLVCSVALRPKRGAIAATIFERADALDTPALSVIFASISDNPGAASDTVSAFVGQNMVEAASAAATQDAAVPVAGVYATFNGTPSSGVIMSNGNLTVTHGSTTASTGVRSTALKTTGKFYFEIKLVGSVSNANYIGIILSSGSYSDMPGGNNYSGVALHTGFGTYVYSNDGSQFVNFSSPQSAVGHVWSFAVDLTARLFWARVNGGNWLNSGTANPATATGGFTIEAGSFAPFVRFDVAQTTDAFTANFGATTFAYAVPSGFTSGWTI